MSSARYFAAPGPAKGSQKPRSRSANASLSSCLLIRSENFWDGIFFKKLSNSKRFENLFLQLQSLKKFDKKYFTRMSVISLLFYFCFLLQYALLVSAFSHNTELLNYLLAGNLIMFIKTVIPPISLGELGIREGASVFFLTRFGELSAVAFNASIFLFVINILFPALVGLFLLLKNNDDQAFVGTLATIPKIAMARLEIPAAQGFVIEETE